MNSEFPNSPEDRLLDELLREQAHGPDEAFLQQIEKAVDAGPALAEKLPVPRHYGRFAIAAGITLATGGFLWSSLHNRQSQASTAVANAEESKAKGARELQALNRAIRDQEDKVEERRKVLATIVRTKGIIYKGQDSFYGQAGANEDQAARGALQTYNELQTQKMQAESQLNSLQKYEGEERMRYASGLDLPENGVKNTYPEYLKTERELNQLRIQGLGGEHPTVRATEEKKAEIQRKLDEGVADLKENLKGQLAVAGDRLKNVESMKDSTHEEAIKRGLDAQDYVDAKRDFENDQQQLQEMKQNLAALSGERTEIASDAMAKKKLAGMPHEMSNGGSAPVVTETRTIPGPGDNFGDMSALSSLASGGMSGGLGGSGSGKGTGSGAGMGEGGGSGKLFGLIPNSQGPAKASAVDSRSSAGRGALLGETAPEASSGDRYGAFIDQPWKTPDRDPLSTFSIDVDTASYANVRRMIREGREIPKDAVRIEEFINAFKYHYEAPKGDGPFAVGASLAVCPWAPAHQLVRVSIKGREIETGKRPASNLVFLIDVSGSMQSPDKLPLLKQSMETMVSQLDERDRVAIVVYAGSEGVALPSTRLDEEGRAKVLATLAKLGAGGSTNGGAGIKRAYELAMEQKIQGGVNRVILATDGDFNVGVTGKDSLVELVKDRAKSGVYLTVAGFGSGNLNDAMMDAITHDGNGNYFYIDSEREGRKVFLQNLAGTLVTIAKDVKIQVEFNPAKVGSYRLIGYANRVLKNEDFNNDKVDAGDIGAGHTVTAFYELTPVGAASGTDGLKYQAAPEKPAATNEWLTVKLRHKHPEGDESSKIEFPLTGDPAPLDKADGDFQFATAAALLGMKLRGMDEAREMSWDQLIALAKPGLADDSTEDRAEFVELVKKLRGGTDSAVPREETDVTDEVAGNNVRVIRHQDGSRAILTREPDLKVIIKKTYSPNGVLTMKATYRIDENGNPLGCKIVDGQNQELFSVRYGYHRTTGRLVEELMFDSRVKRTNPDTGKEMPVQKVTYLYDAEGKRSEPVIFNLLPGQAFEQVFGQQASALDPNLFKEAGEAEVVPGNR